MRDNSLEAIYQCIGSDRNFLEKITINEEKNTLKKFKVAYFALDKKTVNALKDEDNSSDIYFLILREYAELSARFYLFLTENNISLSEENLNNIQIIFQKLSNLTNDYQAFTTNNIKNILKVYQDLLTSEISLELRNELFKLIYDFYKLEVTNLIYPVYIDKEKLIPFVIEDINEILKNTHISENLKNSLERYLLDTNLMLEHFNKVILIINVALTKKRVSDTYLTSILNKTLYQDLHFQKVEINLIKEDYKKYEKLKKKYLKEDNKENILMTKVLETKNLNLIYLYISEHLFQIETIIEQFKEHFDVVLLLKILFTRIKDIVANALWFKEEFIKQGINYDYEVDCAVISNLDVIPKDSLLKYILATNNEYLIRYALNSQDKEYYLTNFLKTENIYSLEKDFFLNLERFLPIDNLLYLDIAKNHKMVLIDEYLSNEDNPLTERYDYLLNSYFNLKKHSSNVSIDYILTKIFAFKDKELIIRLLLAVENRAEVLDIINKISLTELKQSVINYISKAIRTSNTFKFLIREEVEKLVNSNHNRIYTEYFINELNEFEAVLVEDKYEAELLIYFIKKFYQAYINWEIIIPKVSEMKREVKQSIYYLLYKGNKEEFRRLIKDNVFLIDSKLASILVNKDLTNITYLIAFLNNEEILHLSEYTLNLFLNHYERNFKTSNFNSYAVNILNSDNLKDIKELLIYVAIKGAMNKEIIRYYDKIKNFKSLVLKGIQNAKAFYLRPLFILKIAKKEPQEFLNKYVYLIFLSLEELTKLNTKLNDNKDLKRRKYYGDLLKFLPQVEVEVQREIVILVTHSKIKEYLNFIKINYPEHFGLMLENISDKKLYEEVLHFNESEVFTEF